MSAFESLIALLHVTALVGALNAAYAGIDRKVDERAAKHKFHEEAQKIAMQILQDLGVLDLSMQDVMTSNRLRRIGIILPVYIICVVANKNLPTTALQTILRWFYRQKCIPLYMFYKKQGDRITAGVMSFLSFGLFFIIAGTLVWRSPILMNNVFLHFAFSVMLIFAVSLVALGMMARMLNEARTIKECKRLSSLVNSRLEQLLTFAQGIIKEYRAEENTVVLRATSRR